MHFWPQQKLHRDMKRQLTENVESERHSREEYLWHERLCR
jgi:hypothetical protein